VKNDELILLGKITRTQGFDGTIVILLDKGVSEGIEKLESVFVVVDGLPVPFFISSSLRSGDLLLLQFEGYEIKEKVKEFTGCNVLAQSGKFSESDDILPVYLEGFSLVIGEGITAGTIIKIVSYPMQVMLVIEDEQSREILIPLNQEWIINIDKKGKILEMQLPEGITSIND